MDKNEQTAMQYDARYDSNELYWGSKPSSTCYRILELMPPDRRLRVLDIGCGEGRNSLFFARNGYVVDAFDISQAGVDKLLRYASDLGISINAFKADVTDFRLSEAFDIHFSTAVFQCIPVSIRPELFEHYKSFTKLGGLNVFSVFVNKPFIDPAPDADANSEPWKSGELLSYYHNWQIEWCTEEIFDCLSSGVPHKHAVNRVVARRV